MRNKIKAFLLEVPSAKARRLVMAPNKKIARLKAQRLVGDLYYRLGLASDADVAAMVPQKPVEGQEGVEVSVEPQDAEPPGGKK